MNVHLGQVVTSSFKLDSHNCQLTLGTVIATFAGTGPQFNAALLKGYNPTTCAQGANFTGGASLNNDNTISLALDGGVELLWPKPMIKPGVGNISEGNSGTVVMQVPVTLSNPSASAVTVDWHTLDTGAAGIATAGVDYVAASGTVTFAPGETSKTVSITVNGDTVHEPPLLYGEWILVAFNNASANATLDTSFYGLGIGVIIDDD